MKRKPTGPSAGSYPVDVARRLTGPQLRGVGLVANIWNEISYNVDISLWRALRLSDYIGPEVVGQIQEAKKADFVVNAAKDQGIPKEVVDVIESTCGAIDEMRNYRNAVVHSRTFDLASGISHLTARGTTYEVLRSESALEALIQRLIALHEEMEEITRLFTLRIRIADPRKEPLSPEALQCVQKVRDLQKSRQSLSPLPAFPASRLSGSFRVE